MESVVSFRSRCCSSCVHSISIPTLPSGPRPRQRGGLTYHHHVRQQIHAHAANKAVLPQPTGRQQQWRSISIHIDGRRQFLSTCCAYFTIRLSSAQCWPRSSSIVFLVFKRRSCRCRSRHGHPTRQTHSIQHQPTGWRTAFISQAPFILFSNTTSCFTSSLAYLITTSLCHQVTIRVPPPPLPTKLRRPRSILPHARL